MLIVCTVIEFDGQYMTCQDYNDSEAIYYSVFMGGESTGDLKTQCFPRINDLVLIGIDDEGRAHFLKALYNNSNERPFSDVEKIGVKSGSVEISYNPDSDTYKNQASVIELATAIKSAVTFEDLKIILTTLLNVVMGHLHVGVTPGGPSDVSGIPDTVTITALTTLSTTLDTAKSQNVKLS